MYASRCLVLAGVLGMRILLLISQHAWVPGVHCPCNGHALQRDRGCIIPVARLLCLKEAATRTSECSD